MDGLFAFLLLLSILAFLISWINANWFIKISKNQLSKGQVRLILGLLIIVFFVSFGMASDQIESQTANINNQEQQTLNIQVEQTSAQNQSAATNTTSDNIKLSIVEPSNNSKIKADKVDVKGNVQPKDSKVVLENSNKLIKVDTDGNFTTTLILAKGENKFNFIAENGEFRTNKGITIIRELSAEEFRKQFKSESKSISYKELFRNIDKYKEQKVHFTGKVVQVIGDGNFLSSMRVEVTRGSYDIWDDVVLITILDSDAPKILEGDIIKFWGIVEGETSYQTVLGATVSVPEINAEIVELSK